MTLTRLDAFSVEEETIVKRVYVLEDLEREKMRFNEEIERSKDEIATIDILINKIKNVIIKE